MNKSVYKFEPDSPRTPPDSPDNDSYGDGISPLTEPNTPEKGSKRNTSHKFAMPFPSFFIKNPQTELEEEYLMELERNYNEYKNVVASIDFITNKYINDLQKNPNVRTILTTYEDAVACYNAFLGKFINISVFISQPESNLIDFIIEGAKKRIQILYSESIVGGKQKTRKNKKIKRKTNKKIKRKTNKKIKCK